jgi:ribulose-bisphosphate carboxylase small chain
VDTQIEYLVGKDLTPMIEHVEPSRASSRYWYMWKLPLFGERDPEVIRSEVEECIHDNPTHHVRLIGFDPRRQTQVVAFVVSRGVPSD